MDVSDFDTPALLIDLDAFEHNLDALDALMAGSRAHSGPICRPRSARRGQEVSAGRQRDDRPQQHEALDEVGRRERHRPR